MEHKEYSLEIGGKVFTAQFTNLADQSHGSVIFKCNDTVLLATAVMDENPGDGGWFPLSVEYEERFYAAGRILGGQYTRREGRPSDEAVLSGRIVDRTIRPLFDQRIRNSVQVVITILSLGDDDPDVLAVNAASLALATSNIPWNGPVSAVRIGSQDGSSTFSINPGYIYRKDGLFSMDLLVCGKDGNINMIEVGAQEAPEALVVRGFEESKIHLAALQTWQESIIKDIGAKKREIVFEKPSEALSSLFTKEIMPILAQSVMTGTPGKEGIKGITKQWKSLVEEKLPDESPANSAEILEKAIDALIHTEAIEHKRRPDGRSIDEVRSLYAQAGGISRKLHGTGIFYRGETHILSVVTLGSPGDAQTIEGMEQQETKRFLHHYNFPPFSVGETGRVGGFNRRMIGHGALAEKALEPVIPAKADFPYTIRLVSEAFASNGSTSMGSVCASTLALMDAGVPITKPVAGIASGLMMKNPKTYTLLTDIQGPEDHYGDMDFKVAGTRDGITAVQMDIKVDGIPIPILTEALEKARIARLQILDVMQKTLEQPRAELSPFAPHILTTRIKTDQIGLVIGSGGKTIKEIKEVTGADITIEDDGSVFITGSKEGARRALTWIEDMTREYKPGETAEGVVTRIADFGAFVKISSFAEGLVHVSEIAPFRVVNVADFLKVGDAVPVVIKEIDDSNRIALSIKRRSEKWAETKNPTVAAALKATRPEHPRPNHSRNSSKPGNNTQSS